MSEDVNVKLTKFPNKCTGDESVLNLNSFCIHMEQKTILKSLCSHEQLIMKPDLQAGCIHFWWDKNTRKYSWRCKDILSCLLWSQFPAQILGLSMNVYFPVYFWPLIHPRISSFAHTVTKQFTCSLSCCHVLPFFIPMWSLNTYGSVVCGKLQRHCFSHIWQTHIWLSEIQNYGRFSWIGYEDTQCVEEDFLCFITLDYSSKVINFPHPHMNQHKTGLMK